MQHEAEKGIKMNKIGDVSIYVASYVNEDGSNKAKLVVRLDNGMVYPLMDHKTEAHLRPVGDDFKEAIDAYHKEHNDQEDLAKRLDLLENAIASLADDISVVANKVEN